MYEIEVVLQAVTPIIKKNIYYTSPQEREDLEQELKMKIFEKQAIWQQTDTPTFLQFIERD
ncbi:hypothetical protein [Priestia taiwanensis]|uniref:Uncharacterized protein n=1 Tax=Priestia taiwanensis TaxID=1347902 RepID=A0A917EPB6_9BACI|nr:hypothetical protein [Priestia taiwanensis]MBM7363981.1 hypothetical protein [Priestia taiwanensis]GGE70697.1 hypothetical protein GCM10007140_20710 [Priestia taiwanensis]